MLSKAFKRSLIPVGLGGLMLGGCAVMPETAFDDASLPQADAIATIINQEAHAKSASAKGASLGAPWLKLGATAGAPIGHAEFCDRLPVECSFKAKKPVFTILDKTAWSEIVQVNADVNSQYHPRTDQEIFGFDEYWTFPQNNADCEDYMLEKRKRLIAMGWSPASLLATVVLQPNGEGHAVLTVRTDRGDFVLDNMRPEILPWSQTGYRFVKAVNPLRAESWQAVSGIDDRGPDVSLIEHVGIPVLRPALHP